LGTIHHLGFDRKCVLIMLPLLPSADPYAILHQFAKFQQNPSINGFTDHWTNFPGPFWSA